MAFADDMRKIWKKSHDDTVNALMVLGSSNKPRSNRLREECDRQLSFRFKFEGWLHDNHYDVWKEYVDFKEGHLK